jgi:prevent-host-death family protein
MLDRSAVGVRELRQNLSVYLERVRRGERLLVTDRRQIVAVLSPVEPTEDPLATLVATGRARAAARPASRRPRPITLRGRLSLSQALKEQLDDAI